MFNIDRIFFDIDDRYVYSFTDKQKLSSMMSVHLVENTSNIVADYVCGLEKLTKGDRIHSFEEVFYDENKIVVDITSCKDKLYVLFDKSDNTLEYNGLDSENDSENENYDSYWINEQNNDCEQDQNEYSDAHLAECTEDYN